MGDQARRSSAYGRCWRVMECGDTVVRMLSISLPARINIVGSPTRNAPEAAGLAAAEIDRTASAFEHEDLNAALSLVGGKHSH